jgi:V8-like Glu-specific endopeptidase
MKILFFLCLASFSLNSFAIYDEDDRKDLFEITDPKLKKVATAMAYQIEFVELSGWTFNRFWTRVMEPFQQRGICEDEKFAKQLSMRNNCTAILVSPKHLLTAGNCITDHYCSNDLYWFMFDYSLKNGGPFDVKHHNDNFFRCDKIVKRVFDPNTATSFTLMELKKTVKGVTPMKYRKSGSLELNEELIVMGHPRGLPLKIANNVQVWDQNETHFTLNSDISGETRGAAILNAKSLELEGIMVYGTPNYEQIGRDCQNTPVYPNSGARELAIKTSVFKELLDALPHELNQ